MQWPFGVEVFANLEGRYFDIVADYNNDDYFESVRICSLGLFATVYDRDLDIVSAVTVTRGTSKIIQVSHIKSQLSIGNVLNINLRQKQGDQLEFVSLINTSEYAEVLIDATDLRVGFFVTAVLESIDLDSSERTVLKTDTISIMVVQSLGLPYPPDQDYFVHAPDSKEIFIGKPEL